MPRTLACILVLASMASALCAEDPPATLSLIVSDAKGNRIPSLARDEFQVTCRGAKNEITDFSEMPRVQRRIVVVLDLTTLTLGARSTIVEALRDFLAKSLRPGDRVLILTAGQNLTALSAWTDDRAQIEAALHNAGGSTAQTMAGDRANAEKRIRELITDIQQATQTFYTFDTLVEAVRVYAAAVYRDTSQSLSLISGASDLFPSRATRNIMIVAGAGLPMRAGADLFQYLDTVKAQAEQGQLGGALRQGAARSSPMSDASSYDLTPIFRDFVNEAWNKGVAIYTIDSEMSESASTQVESQRATDRASSFATIANRSAGYQFLADNTGGVAFLARRPSDALAQILADLDSFYSITIRPAAPLNAKDAVQVRSKSGYRVRVTPGSAPQTPDADVRGRVVAYHLLKPESNDLGIEVQAAPPVVDGNKRRVAIKVMIPIKNLKFVSEGNEVTGGFTVYIATGDPLGHSSAVTRQSQQLRWPSGALQAAGDKKITFAVEVVLEPGRNQISVGVLDDRSRTTGFDRVSI